MIEHTPGPWETDLDEHEEPNEEIRVRNSLTKETICKVWQDDAYGMHEYNARRKEDARLIAAAPELLEVLAEWVEYTEGMFTAEELERACDCAEKTCVLCHYRKARTIIDKAKGE